VNDKDNAYSMLKIIKVFRILFVFIFLLY
jgi:hypothetical protein